MKSRLILALAGVCAIALTIALVIAPSASQTQRASAAVHGLSLHHLTKSQKRHISGFASFEAGIGVSTKTPRARANARMSNAAVNLCPRNFGPNVLVNQNCLNVTDPDLQGRGQAQNETAIAQNKGLIGLVEKELAAKFAEVPAQQAALTEAAKRAAAALHDFQGFLEKTRGIASGWISFYWGKTIAEYRKTRKLDDAMMASWLEFFKEQGPRVRAP